MPKDNKDELFWLVDEDDNELGSVKRGEAVSNPDIIHRAIQIVLINDQNQTLLQKRSMSKDSYPGYWTVSASGHVDYGLTYDETAKKELEEELGITGISLEFISKHIVRMPHETEYEALYTGKINLTPEKLDPYEVSEVMWVSIEELPQFVKDNKLTLPAIKTYQALGYIE